MFARTPKRVTTVENSARRLGILLAVLAMFAGGGRDAAAGKLRASCVKVDITPQSPVEMQAYPRTGPSQGIRDHIYHRIVALDDGKTQFFLVSSDLALIRFDVYKDFCKKLESETGIKAAQVWWNTTQTHSGPSIGFSPERSETFKPNAEYSEWMKRSLIRGLQEARAKLEPALLGAGSAWSMANINRRPKDITGKIPYLGMNPEGAVDRQVGLLRLDHTDGRLLALIGTYPIHGTVLPVEGPAFYRISGDVKGVVADYVEKTMGAPMLFMSGAEGNVAPIYSTLVMPNAKVKGMDHLDVFKVLLGDRIIASSRWIAATTSDVEFKAGSITVDTPITRQKISPWLEEAVRSLRRKSNGGADRIRLPIDFFKINEDILLWSAPVELFCEIAMAVREQSPFAHTFFYGLNNGYIGYLPTRQAFAEGGFEPSISIFTKQAEADFTGAVLTYIWSLPKR